MVNVCQCAITLFTNLVWRYANDWAISSMLSDKMLRRGCVVIPVPLSKSGKLIARKMSKWVKEHPVDEQERKIASDWP